MYKDGFGIKPNQTKPNSMFRLLVCICHSLKNLKEKILVILLLNFAISFFQIISKEPRCGVI